MEKIVNLHIEKLLEEVYLATSDELPIFSSTRKDGCWNFGARDVARKLLEARSEHNEPDCLQPIAEQFEYPLVVSQ